jgi:hypothetical protein
VDTSAAIIGDRPGSLRVMALGWLGSHEGPYAIGTRLLERATLAGGRLTLRDAALPYRQELYAVTPETVNLAVLDGPEILYLEKLVGRRPVTQQASRAASDRLGPAGRRSPLRSPGPYSEERGRVT